MMVHDRLSSLVSGMGTPRDKLASVYRSVNLFTPADAMAAYRGDWIARKVVDIPAMDQTRAWRSWQAADDQIQKLEAEESRLKLKQRVLQALKWARLFGGAALILGTGDADPAQPLNVKALGSGGLQYVHVASCLALQAGDIDRDVTSPGYGEPIVYRMQKPASGTVNIHPSRVVRFIGSEAPDEGVGVVGIAGTNIGNPYAQGWGDSVLQALDDAVKNAGIAAGGIASLVLEAKVDVYKIPNLSQRASNPEWAAGMLSRFQVANQGKSIQNALLVDTEEEWDQKSIAFAGLTDVLTLYLEIVAAAADIPATRMLAKQSKGLGNGGDADLKNYYDSIGAQQEMTLRPALEKLDELLIRSALGSRPAEVHFRFDPLWQMSETERAAIRKSDAETAKTIMDSGLVPKRATALGFQNMLVDQGSYPGLEAALAAMGERDDNDPWTGLSSAELKDRLAAWQAGAIPYEVVFNELQRAGLIPVDATAEAYLEQIENEGLPGSAGEEGVTRVETPPVAPTIPAPGAPPAAPVGEPPKLAAVA